MASNFIFALILLLTIHLCLAKNNFPFSKMKDLDNVLFPSNVLFDRGVRSKLECVTSCSQTSGCFFLTFYGGNRCRGHSGVETSPAAGTATPGARTYMAADWQNVPCTVVSDCPTLVDNVQCYQGQCQCQVFNRYTANNRSCTEFVNGNWGTWGSWGTCSVTCAGGSQSRTRLCDNPAPANGGANCVGSSSESLVCNTLACPWLDKSCTANSDCPTNINNVLCFEGLCNCVPGYYYSVSTRLCIAVCPQRDLQTGFTRYPDHEINGYNLFVSFASTMTECENICLDYNDGFAICRTADFVTSSKLCFIQNVTPLDVPSAWAVSNSVLHMLRKCA